METIESYLAALASERPAPGGGSAAILVAASGAALVAMVARICSRNPKYAEQRALIETLVRRADDLRADLLERRARDERAFEQVMAAMALPRATSADKERRARELEGALHGAASEPLGAARQSAAVLRLAQETLAVRNANLISDVGCAAEFAYAAVAACAYNVRINHRFMKDTGTIVAQAAELETCEYEATTLLAGIRSAVNANLASASPSTSSG